MDSEIIEKDMQNIYNRNIDLSSLQNKTVLITGATGMLASYLIYFFIYLNVERNYNIKLLLMVRNINKCHQKFKTYLDSKMIEVLVDDINKPLEYAGKIDFIIHTASLASPQYYESNPVEVAEPNVIATYHLLKFANEKKISKFLFFSSGDVYGKLPFDVEDISENIYGTMDPLDVHSCYGESKRMGETWCSIFSKEYAVPTSIVRIGHTYAPTMDVNNDPRVFASFIKCVLNGKDIIMLSDGSAKRPFCYIADAVAAFILILLKGENGQAYNMCNTKEFLSIKELADLMTKLRPELGLKVICKKRRNDDNYLENVLNKSNKPIEIKLKMLGWECQYDSFSGFNNVLKYLLQSYL